MNKRPAKGGAGDGLTLDDIPDLVDVKTLSAATRLSAKVIKNAIKRGDLAAFIPGPPRPRAKIGRGMGYRIRKADAQSWFFGAMRGES